MDYLITFESTAQAIRAEDIFLKNNVKVKIRPLPNEISSGCGISIAFADLVIVKKLVADNQIIYNRIYLKQNNEYREKSD